MASNGREQTGGSGMLCNSPMVQSGRGIRNDHSGQFAPPDFAKQLHQLLRRQPTYVDLGRPRSVPGIQYAHIDMQGRYTLLLQKFPDLFLYCFYAPVINIRCGLNGMVSSLYRFPRR